MNDLISVIVPVYNVEKYLTKCIDSIITQSYSNLEILLINDGSTDNSLKICREFEKKDCRVKVIDKPNSGVSNTRNLGISAAEGKYIIFIDSDDYIKSNMIELLYKYLIEYNSDASMCDIVKVDENDNVIESTQNNEIKKLSKLEFLSNVFDFRYSYGYPINKLFKKEKLDKVRFREDVHFMEDFTFVCDIVYKECSNIVYIPDKLYCYLQRSGSAIHTKFNEKWLSRLSTQKYIIEEYLEFFNERCKILFLYDYVMMILSAYSFLKLNHRLEKSIKNDIKIELKKYYKLVISSKYITIYEKIKIFGKKNLPSLYFYIMNMR